MTLSTETRLGITQLCIPIIGPTLFDVKIQLEQASEWTDLVEMRFDLWESIDENAVEQLRLHSHLPCIFTLRKASHGGKFIGTEEERIALISSLLRLQPEFADIEADVPLKTIQKLQSLSPNTKWIISWHQFDNTPQDLDELYSRLSAIPGDYYKLVTYATTVCDALRMLHLAKKVNAKKKILCALCMGENGQCTRILSPLVGNPFTFAALKVGQESAPGQLSAQEIIDIYRFHEINPHTLLLGLLGNPVIQSKGHLIHNAAMRAQGINGVYVKFEVLPEEMNQFFDLIKSLNLHGLSVTMPYKEEVISYLDTIDEELSFIGACNTLLFRDSKLTGCNTDGIGVVKALGTTLVQGKKILIIGAGGTSKAAAYQLSKLDARLTILNRTPERARELALQLNAKWGCLSDFNEVVKNGYDVLIQTTSVGMAPNIDQSPVSSEFLKSESVILDVIANPKETRLLREARLKGCKTVSGLEVFINQAVQQFSYWFDKQNELNAVEKTMRKCLDLPLEKRFLVRKSQLRGHVRIPPSKSHSIRAILLGAMAQGTSIVRNILESPDTIQAIKSAKQLGAIITENEHELVITGVAGAPTAPDNVIDAGNSGQVLRFAAALASLGKHYTVFTGDHSIRSNRPIQPLLDGLHGLGVFAESTRQNGYAPFIVKGPLRPGEATLSGEDSQPVSALLMASAFVSGITHIHVKNPGETPWINLTLAWLDRLGVPYTNEQFQRYTVKGNPVHKAFTYNVPGDFSSAAFPLVAALITQSSITIHNIDMDDVQGDKLLIFILQQMGASIEVDRIQSCLHVQPSNRLKGITIDVNPMIDAITILAVVGCFAKGETRLINGANARNKECNRIDCIVSELKKMGAKIRVENDEIIIQQSNLKGANVESYGDHRMAMSMIVAGLAAEGETRVNGIECIGKSYPSFVADLRVLGADLTNDF